VDQMNRSLSSADRITDVSDPCETNGYIEFEDNTGTGYRIDIAANNYIEYGPVGNLFTTPITAAGAIRFVKAEVIFSNPGPGQDRTFTTSTYLRTNATIAVGMWELDDASGLTAADSSGKGRHGTLTNMAGDEWTTGIFGGALAFDGSNDYILVPVLSDYATSLTFSAWFKSDDAGSIGNNYLSQRFISQPRSDWYSRIAFGINSNKIGTYWHDGVHNVGEGTTILSAGVWYHGALSYDGSTIRLYLDGTEEDSFSESNLTAPSSSYYVQIGRQISGERCFDGVLDDVYIYDRVLSAEEIAELADILRCRGFTEAKAGSDTTSITIGTPSGTSEDDLLIAAVATNGNTSPTLSPPGGEGWTEIDISNYVGTVSLGAWWKLADASESPTHQFTWSGASWQAYGWMMRFTGHDTASPIDVYAEAGDSSSTPTSPAVTTTIDNALILRLGAFDENDITEDAPGLAGHTAITMDSSSGIVAAYQEFTESKRSSGDTSLTINTPAGASKDDLLIAAVVTDEDTSGSLAPPGGEGWSQISVADESSDVTLGVWWKNADASESASHQFSWSGFQEAYGWMMRFTGHDTSSPINDSATNGGSSSSPTSPSVSTGVSNCLVLRIGGFDDDDVSVDNTGLSGHTDITMDESSLGSNTCSGGAGFKTQLSIGASGTSNFSLTGFEQYRTVTIAISPDSSGGIDAVSGGAGYLIQPAAGASGTSTFALTASQQSQMITIEIHPKNKVGAILP